MELSRGSFYSSLSPLGSNTAMNLGGTCLESLGGGWGRFYCQLSLLSVTMFRNHPSPQDPNLWFSVTLGQQKVPYRHF